MIMNCNQVVRVARSRRFLDGGWSRISNNTRSRCQSRICPKPHSGSPTGPLFYITLVS